MGYAAEVKAFEKSFREVTGREPSGDLAKDADILSRYGENALTDMGHTSEPTGQVHTWGGVAVIYLDSDRNPTNDEGDAAFRIVTKEDGSPVVESINRYDPSNPWDQRSRYDEEGKRYTSTGLLPSRVLGASDQNQAAAEIVDQHMVGRSTSTSGAPSSCWTRIGRPRNTPVAHGGEEPLPKWKSGASHKNILRTGMKRATRFWRQVGKKPSYRFPRTAAASKD